MSRNAQIGTMAAAVLALVLVVVYIFVGVAPAASPARPTASPLPTSAIVTPSLPAVTSAPPATSAPAFATTAPGAWPTTAEQAANALASALQSSDFAALEPLVTPNGFNWAKSGSGGLAPKSPQEAIQFLRAESGGRLQVTVSSRPIKASAVPWGPRAIESTWRGFGNVPQQAIDLVLHEVGGRWYWAGGYITG